MIAAVILTLAIAGAAHAKPALRDVPEIDNNMLWVALAIEISDNCDDISPRTLKGLFFLNTLKNKAQALGYSNEEIRAYVKSDAEKARMRERGETYVKAQGLEPADTGDLCKLGHAEIARGSQIGVLLRAK
jgi:hypothetical protein